MPKKDKVKMKEVRANVDAKVKTVAGNFHPALSKLVSILDDVQRRRNIPVYQPNPDDRVLIIKLVVSAPTMTRINKANGSDLFTVTLGLPMCLHSLSGVERPLTFHTT
jgi:hypothetical protein